MPEFLRQLRTYTEMDCRFICLQLAQVIKVMHDAGLAHRNLNLENVIIDPMVRSRIAVLLSKFVHRAFDRLSHRY